MLYLGFDGIERENHEVNIVYYEEEDEQYDHRGIEGTEGTDIAYKNFLHLVLYLEEGWVYEGKLKLN